MKGAAAVPPPMTINMPNSSKTKIIGNSQYFFRYLTNSHISLKNSILDLLFFDKIYNNEPNINQV